MRRRKIKQNSEYVPLDESDLKKALEVPVKSLKEEDLIKIEKQGKKGKPQNSSQVRNFGTPKTEKFSRIGKLKTRTIMQEAKETEEPEKESKNYILIITEKPQAALKISLALGDSRRKTESGVSYYELERQGKKIVIAAAVGHLFTLTSKEKGWPIFNIKWEPNFKVKKQDWSKRYYLVLKKLVSNASEFIVATDYDVEGEVIGLNIIRFIAGIKDAKRMKFSTLTKPELEKAYENTEKTINWGQAIAGETRHYLDWMYGINLSRALMSAIQKTGSFRIMSIGRVQGPSLNLIVERELEIQNFKPEPYWQVFIKLKNHQAVLKYEKDIKEKKDLEKFRNLEGKEGKAETEKKPRNLQPPAPFDLTSLQREAYRLFRINPSYTLQLAQNLYLAGLISYPRTSSQKIPFSISPLNILKKLSAKFREIKFAERKFPVEGKKSDPAHPSIYPTGEFSDMNEDEEKIYNLIVKRFISCFCKDAKLEDKKITFDVNKLKFIARGLEIKEKGWLQVYPAIIKEIELEDISGKKIIEKVNIEDKLTQPPKRYTPASLITELEKRNLGTKATRASIIETLYNRSYVKEQSIQATSLGIQLISTLSKYSPIIIDEKLTRHFEKELLSIQEAKKNLENLKEIILKEAEKTIKKISNDFKKNEEDIGKELIKANQDVWKQEREANVLNSCPNCKEGKLRIIYNKKFKRSFVACNAYPKCKTTYSLPPGLIKKTDKICDKCGFPLVIRIQKGKRPWIFCFNEKNH